MMRAIAFVFHVFVVSGSFQHILVAFVVSISETESACLLMSTSDSATGDVSYLSWRTKIHNDVIVVKRRDDVNSKQKTSEYFSIKCDTFFFQLMHYNCY